MTTIDELIATMTSADALKMLTTKSSVGADTIEANRKAYNGDHAILHDSNRADKVVGDGTSSRIVKYVKEVINFQKVIVETAVSFVFGKPVLS